MSPHIGPEHPLAARSSGGGPIFDDGEGRIARSFRLLGQSWEFLRERPRLMIIPVISAVATTIGALVIFAPILVLTHEASFKVSFFIATAVTLFPFTFVATYLNVAFLGMVQDHMHGREPTVRSGLALARSRLRPIAAWSLLATGVGVVISALQHLPFGAGEWVARVVSWLGGLAWALATFFVVPVLALHGPGAHESVRRSARTFRDRWGETLIGDVGLSAAFAIITIPACMTGAAGAIALDEGAHGLGIMLIGISILIACPLIALQTALTELFSLVLYREATDGVIVGPYSEDDLRRSFEKRKPPFWRRNL